MALTLRSNKKLEKIELLLAKIFRNKTSGAEIVLDAWTHLRLRTLTELKNVFTEQELHALADAFDSITFEPQFACSSQFIKNQIEDTIQFGRFSQDWEIVIDDFLLKVDGLTSAQNYFLLEEIQNNFPCTILFN